MSSTRDEVGPRIANHVSPHAPGVAPGRGPTSAVANGTLAPQPGLSDGKRPARRLRPTCGSECQSWLQAASGWSLSERIRGMVAKQM